MARLIDANTLMEQVNNLCSDGNENWIGTDNKSYIDHADVVDIISVAPTVDAVEVVRWKDCENWVKCESSLIGEVMCCKGQGSMYIQKAADDFCSCGRKMKG